MNAPGTSELAVQLLSAIKFASEKHRQQRRKDTDATPYINHPIAVAELLARVGGVSDLKALQAAILHDTIEDTQTRPDEISHLFGDDVLKLVQELTDDKSLPKAERKRLQIVNAPHKSPTAKAIKLADKISNISEFSSTQPADWPLQRKLEYLDWGNSVVAGLRGANAPLEKLFDEVLANKRRELEASEPR
jgi:guanosine-3',5'-bis(diphosphate) 3'-pyrophosphohydrolase